MPRGKTGARRSPQHATLHAPRHRAAYSTPPQFGYFPKQLDMWGNDQYGDCVSAEEAFAKACASPEIFVTAQTVIQWAERHGFLNGADLAEVLDAMRSGGFQVGSQQYNDGGKLSVDYSHEPALQSAIADPNSAGPVKIAIDAAALPSGAGNQQGWYAFGGSPGQYGNTDHCVAVCAYGPPQYLAAQLGVPVPPGAPSTVYGLYTWHTIGMVDHAWLMSTCTEAWTRQPTTVGIPPLPGPTPPPGPTPIPPPGPIPPLPPVPVPPAPGGVWSFQGTITPPAQLGLPPIPWAQLLQILLAILQALQPLLPTQQQDRR